MKTLKKMTVPGYCTIEVAEVSKGDAEYMLEGNYGNRKLNRNQVELLKKAMNDRKWMFNGDSIVIDRDGTLKSGQHRLKAFLMSNVVKIVFLIVRLIRDEDVICTLNTGKPLSNAQYLALRGVKNASFVSSAAKQMMLLDRYVSDQCIDFISLHTKFVFQKYELEDYVYVNSELISSFYVSSRQRRVSGWFAGNLAWIAKRFNLMVQITDGFKDYVNADMPRNSMACVISKTWDVVRDSVGSSQQSKATAKTIFSIVDFICTGDSSRRIYATDIRMSIRRLTAKIGK